MIVARTNDAVDERLIGKVSTDEEWLFVGIKSDWRPWWKRGLGRLVRQWRTYELRMKSTVTFAIPEGFTVADIYGTDKGVDELLHRLKWTIE